MNLRRVFSSVCLLLLSLPALGGFVSAPHALAVAGKITEFPIPTSGSEPMGITRGPDGNFWFVEFGTDKIGRITPRGTITEFPFPTGDSGLWLVGITAGPDGNLWFTENLGEKI